MAWRCCTHHDSDHLVWTIFVDTPCIIENFLGPRSEQIVDAAFDLGSEHLPTCLYTRTHMSTHVSVDRPMSLSMCMSMQE